jgi:hypothetical protein
MLELAVGSDLYAVHMIDYRRRPGGRCEESGYGREEGLAFHDARIALSTPK